MREHSLPLTIVCLLAAAACLRAADRGQPWKAHRIDTDQQGRGADGARFRDVNGDGLPDIVSGWEEARLTRVYLHPGYKRVKEGWPAVTVGTGLGGVEDAVFCDLDSDGRIDVVSSSEGRKMFFHWAPKKVADYLDANAWKTDPLPAAEGKNWMFALPMQVDGQHGIDIVAGGKGSGLVWYRAPENPRNVGAWTKHVINETASWTMGIYAEDIDGDGDDDLVSTVRKTGVRWFENPGPGAAQQKPWKTVWIGAKGEMANFGALKDLDADGLKDVVLGVGRQVGFLRRLSKDATRWDDRRIDLPSDVGGVCKGANVGDVDLDGKTDIVLTFAKTGKDQSAAIWLSYRQGPMDSRWDAHEISGHNGGTKLDSAELLDIDGDGDLDLLTTDEQGMQVKWYENPTR